MSYKKDDILRFMSKMPHAHLWEMFGHGEATDKESFEPKEYHGFVKSVISAKDGIYLMDTIKPLKGFICVATDSDVIRQVAESELPEEERKRKLSEWLEAPNVYIPANDADYSMLSEQEHCIALAKEALQHLFPEITVESFDFIYNWFTKNGFVSTMGYFDEDVEQIENPDTKKELRQIKNDILKIIEFARFKEYHTIRIGTPTEEEYEGGIMKGFAYFIVAVSKEFDEVCILRDIKERSDFFRSLGPEFNEIEEAIKYYRGKVMDTKLSSPKKMKQ